MTDEDAGDHQHPEHHHGHAHDRGLSGALRYLRWAPQMWRSEINDAVVELVDPQRHQRVVDIGAGMGAATVRAAKRGASVTAVEPTPFLRRILQVRRGFQRARKRIHVVDGAAEHIPLPDRSADAVWATNTMHHWVDPADGLAEIARVLRSGGRMVLVDEDFDDPAHPEHDRFGSAESDRFHMVDIERMGQLAAAAGLASVTAGARQLADRPVLAVIAEGPERGRAAG
ncbi:MAG: class I SAM-dependent methyltransferase [Acidimicrobiia bacterium]|nr:class I SAM-dependent methyltransferase [Acidimicrobiia bacterium]